MSHEAERDLGQEKDLRGTFVGIVTITENDEEETYQLFRKEAAEDGYVHHGLYDDTNKRVGVVEIWRENFIAEEAPDKFLAIPSEIAELPFFRSVVKVEPHWQGKGLGRILTEKMRQSLQEQNIDLVHLIYFSEDGEQKLQNNFLAHDYYHVEVTNQMIARKHVEGPGPDERVWMYKVYRGR